MTDYYLVSLLFLTTATLAMYMALFDYYSTPAPCVAARLVLQNPGSEIIAYGKFRVFEEGGYLYLTCGLKIERDRVLHIEKTRGVLKIGTTSSGLLYIS